MKALTEQSKQLKPCPLCGKAANLVDMLSERYHVECSGCGLQLGSTWGTEDSPQYLVEMWNIRQSAPQQGVKAELTTEPDNCFFCSKPDCNNECLNG